jgi:hypothetical protein
LRWQKEKEKVMDFHALQHKLFQMDPTDPKEDLAKLQASVNGGAVGNAPPTKDYVNESVEVPEGSLPIDKNYSLNDFAALAGVTVNETQKTGPAGQAKGKDSMPKAEPGRTKHPLKDKLVGEADGEDRIAALERRIEALEEMLSERELSKGEEKKKEKYVKGMKKSKSDFKDRYGDDAEAVMYATATKMAKESSVDSIKDSLYAALANKLEK